MRLVVVLVVVLLFLVACGYPHYSLSVPPLTAPPAERLDAFYRLRTGGMTREVTCSNDRRMGISCGTADYLVLADGHEIRHPEDLAPLVAPQSNAGASMRRILHYEARKRVLRDVAIVGILGGLAVAIAGSKMDSTPLKYTAGGMAAIGFVFGLGGMVVADWQAEQVTKTLFKQYDDGLARQLNICTRGAALTLVPCDAPDMPVAPDPILRSLPQR